jgi:hypothetical protein
MTVNINNGTPEFTRRAAPTHIDLKSMNGNGAELVNGTFGQHTIKNNSTQELAYPPSPPCGDAAGLVAGAVASAAAIGAGLAARPLTMANVSTLTAAGGSPFSAISTSPVTDEDDGESSGDSASEISFSSASSLSSNTGNTNGKDHRFLASVFGASYLESFAKLGVEVVIPASDVIPAEEIPLQGAAVLHVPALQTKTLYVSPKELEGLDSTTLVELLEIADEDLGCSGVVICLERKSNGAKNADHDMLAETLHALMYVGGSIVAPDSGLVKYDSDKFILVGLDL